MIWGIIYIGVSIWLMSLVWARPSKGKSSRRPRGLTFEEKLWRGLLFFCSVALFMMGSVALKVAFSS